MSEGTRNPAPLPIGWVLKSGLERHLLPALSEPVLWHGAWGIFPPRDLGGFGELGQQVSTPPQKKGIWEKAGTLKPAAGCSQGVS